MAGLWAALRDFFTPHGVEVLQNVHPLIVHFPIGLLFAAALLYLWAWIGRRDALQWTALWTLLLGTIAALFAVWSGWRAGEGVMVAPAVREHILEPHRRGFVRMGAVGAPDAAARPCRIHRRTGVDGGLARERGGFGRMDGVRVQCGRGVAAADRFLPLVAGVRRTEFFTEFPETA
jgi:hypothetical protein